MPTTHDTPREPPTEKRGLIAELALGGPFQPRRVLFPLVAVWAVLLALVVAFVLSMSLQATDQRFQARSRDLLRRVSDHVHTFESVLDGFSAMVDVHGTLDRPRIRAYAEQVIARHPEVFMLEVVERVAFEELAAFEEAARQSVHPDFRVKAFSFESERRWQAVQAKPYYLPIVLMEPMPETSSEVLGLDIDSTAVFRHSLTESARLGRPVATHPVRLVEGPLGYILHRPVGSPRAVTTGPDDALRYLHERYALLLAKAESLLPDLQPRPGETFTLYHRHLARDDPGGRLVHVAGAPRGRLESWLFPAFQLDLAVDSDTQPFALYGRRQVGWSDLNWSQVGLFLTAALVTLGAALAYAQRYQRAEERRVALADTLFRLANYDQLTGLANRGLLVDRLEHAVQKARRQGERLAVVFLDLDDFKPVNDRYGHDAGDRVLREVAARLRTCVRESDTLARRGGDEFVAILEQVASRDQAGRVSAKFREVLREPFRVGEEEVRIHASIGVALFPIDGQDADALLGAADAAMYRDKRQEDSGKAAAS